MITFSDLVGMLLGGWFIVVAIFVFFRMTISSHDHPEERRK